MSARIRASSRIALSWFCVACLTSVVLCGQAMGEDSEGTTGVPSVMLYEGYLTDADGAPVLNGTYDFTFSLYEASTGGDPVWTEEHLGVFVESGVVRVRLGDGTVPHPLDVPFDRQYYLGIRLGSDPEMTPRLELASTAYSFRARFAGAVPDSSITTEKLAPLSVTDDKIVSVSWSKISDVPDVPQGGGQGGKGPSVPAVVWHTRGNRNTDSEKDYVGTADLMDLIFGTDGVERMRIAGDGSEIEVLVDTLKARYVTSRVSPDEGAFFLADPRHGLKRSGGHDVRLYTTGGNILLEGGNVGIGTTTPTAALHVRSTATGNDGDINSYPIRLDTGGQGIAIKVTGDSDVDADNNYVSFWDDGGMRGRIEGQDAIDLVSDPEYIYFTAIDVLELVMATATLVGASSGFTVCAGFGVVTCPPQPSEIAAAAANLALQAARTIGTQAFLWDQLGVGYQSSSGDYAEWLERIDPDEVIDPGDVVGVFGGRITKSTEGAQQVLVVSRSPIVLGNMPAEGREQLYEKVAFMGQVPVKVVGRVSEGDYVIPSGLGDGTGVAVPPRLMTADEYAKVVGRAWSGSDSSLPKPVTVAVGLNQGDVAAIVREQEAAFGAVRDMQAEMAELRARVERLNGLDYEVAALRAALAKLRDVEPAAAEGAGADGGPGDAW
jgi:hypothetical protein